MMNPPHEATRTVLSKRVAMLVGADRRIAVTNGAGGDEYAGAGRKLNYEVEFLENEVATQLGIVVAEGPDGAPALRNVGGVVVAQAADVWAEIEGTRREDTVLEGRLQGRVIVVEGGGLSGVVRPHLRSVRVKGG